MNDVSIDIRRKSKSRATQYFHNKSTFSYMGVVFRVQLIDGKKAICMASFPHAGMDSQTAKRLSKWLTDRAEEIK